MALRATNILDRGGPVMRLLTLLLLSMIMPVAVAYDLMQHLWQQRLLILFAPSLEDPLIQQQRHRVDERRDAIVDRDIRVLEIGTQRGLREGKPLSAAHVPSLRMQLSVEPGERLMILIGLDGGEKRRAPLDTQLTELFQQIDGMPMRRADIRAKHAAGTAVTEP